MITISDVLRAHWTASTHTGTTPFVDKCDGCGEVILAWSDPTVGDGYERLAAHQAAMLTAAGFGPVKEAGAVALEEAADHMEAFGIESVGEQSLRNRAATIRADVA